MSKGTPSMGKKNSGTNHMVCRRCGSRSYHRRHKECASCGFGKGPKMRSYAWAKKN